MMSGRCFIARAIPRSPSSASITSWPARSRLMRISQRTSGSSSITNTRAIARRGYPWRLTGRLTCGNAQT